MTEAAPKPTQEPGPARPDLLRDLRDLVAVLEREPVEPGTTAHRLVAQTTAALSLALAIRDEPSTDITTIRLLPFAFAVRDLDITVAGTKDAEALLAYIKAHGRAGTPEHAATALPQWDPAQEHHQWELSWRDLVLRIGTVIHPDDAAAQPHAARLNPPPSPGSPTESAPAPTTKQAQTPAAGATPPAVNTEPNEE